MTHWFDRLVLLLVALSIVLTQAIADTAPSGLRIAREREHSGQVVFIKAGLPGKQMVSMDYLGSVFVWDEESLRQISTSRRLEFRVTNAAYLGQRRIMVTSADKNQVAAVLDLDSSD